MRITPRLMVVTWSLVALSGAALSADLNPAGEGRRLWLKLNCSGCHGDRAAGGMGPNVQHAEGGDVHDVVQEGGDKGMPPYRSSNLSATDITNLSAYLRSIGTAGEPKFRDWWVAIPPK